MNWRWDIDYIAPLAGLPQVIVPSMSEAISCIGWSSIVRLSLIWNFLVGQFPFFSRATQEIEYLPVCVAVVAAQGNKISAYSI